ncbi:hypothetical protein E2C01_078235 [Portunus trituberculatus]|uniref:Uncharacterized protein n=1 Tax=Portunus trituberculatus TaxID=210409 RepID=A0A5B7IM39_PORTR|nr:hypothetical protein [Portunus trituberculatus]
METKSCNRESKSCLARYDSTVIPIMRTYCNESPLYFIRIEKLKN